MMKIKVIMMMAQSVDGIIAKHHSHFPDWTCSADKKLFKQMTLQAGVLIMGAQTYKTIGKPLAGRLNIVYTRNPERFSEAENLFFTRKDPKLLLADLAEQGFKQVVLTGGPMINSLFIQDRLVDEILLTVSPKIFGRGLSLFAEPVDLDLELLTSRQLDSHTLFFHYRIVGYN
jgi:dihydrofolate reductase